MAFVSTLSGMHDDQKVGKRVHAACIRSPSGSPEKSLAVTLIHDASATPRYPLTINARATQDIRNAIIEPSHPGGHICAIRTLNGRILKKNRTSKNPEKITT